MPSKGYGIYAKKDVNGFWAETITKSLHGKGEKYSRKTVAIAKKKYKLR